MFQDIDIIGHEYIYDDDLQIDENYIEEDNFFYFDQVDNSYKYNFNINYD